LNDFKGSIEKVNRNIHAGRRKAQNAEERKKWESRSKAHTDEHG
jgi:hypothetical protein